MRIQNDTSAKVASGTLGATTCKTSPMARVAPLPDKVTDVLLTLVIVAVPIAVIVTPPVMRLTVKTDEAVALVVS